MLSSFDNFTYEVSRIMILLRNVKRKGVTVLTFIFMKGLYCLRDEETGQKS